jgi:hypothetical protein
VTGTVSADVARCTAKSTLTEAPFWLGGSGFASEICTSTVLVELELLDDEDEEEELLLPVFVIGPR